MSISSAFTSQSNFVSIFDAALESYKRKTKKDLTSHPLLFSLQSCESPKGVLTVLREQVPAFKEFENDGLTKWVTPTVNVLYSFSEIIGQGGLTFPQAGVIFAGIGVLFSAAKNASASRDELIDTFILLERFFNRLEKYTSITPTRAMSDIIVKIMAEVLSILAIATKEVKRGRTIKFFKKLMGHREIEDSLERLDRLTQEHARMASAVLQKMTDSVDDRLGGFKGQVQDVDDRVQDIDSNVRGHGVDDKLGQARGREQEKGDREEREKPRFDTVVQLVLPVHLLRNAGQLKIYRHLFSFLVEKINSMKALDPRLESLLPRLRTHFEKFVNYGIVVSISESRQFRETLLAASLIVGGNRHTIALDEDEKEICTLFRDVLLDSKDKSTIRSLRGEQAKCFMQVLQDALERGSPSLQEDRLQRTAQRLLINLSRACGDVPNELYIKGTIKNVSSDPVNMRGGFGHIYRGMCNGRLVAIKRLFRVGDATLVMFCKEAMIWKDLSGHPHILPFLGVDIESFPGEMCMVSEWMSNGTIIEFLKREPYHAVEKYLLQIAEGIQHLHSQGKYHGDLKGVNILVNSDREAKIADFGFANFVDMSVPHTSVRMGTPKWMAPELLDTSQKFQRTTKSDIFAFACIAFEIYTGAPIFPDDESTRACQRIMAGERPERPTDMQDRMWDLIERCWSQDPPSRPPIEDVVKKMRELQEVDHSVSRNDY